MTYSKEILPREVAKKYPEKPTLFFFILRMKKKKRVWAQWGMNKSWLLESLGDSKKLLEKSTAKPTALRGSFGIIIRRVGDLLCLHSLTPTFGLDYVEELNGDSTPIGKISSYISDSQIQEDRL
jgi:hypothetical protein